MVLVKDKYGENEDEDSASTSESEDEDAKVVLKHRILSLSLTYSCIFHSCSWLGLINVV